ncbi:MAG: pyridoxal 5'-phosphate synthase glutaminase subunit PdxT [Acidimicrobiales bacterium]
MALQGAFSLHLQVLEQLGVVGVEVRTPAQFSQVDALIIPGGESSTMSMLLEFQGLFEPINSALADGMPAFGTCAGMILLAAEILDGRSDQRCFAMLDMSVRRNAYGTQIESFETDLEVVGLESAFHAVFIRAPAIESFSDRVEVLATYGGEPVLCRQGAVMASSFHPELTPDLRLHRLFLDAL